MVRVTSHRRAIMSNRQLGILVLVFFAVLLIAEPAFCGITNAQIKAASQAMAATVTDWIPMVIGGGLALAGVMFFMNKYSYALGALGGVGFLY
ncbi:MAG: hypothetical protein LBH60_03285, partial [Prevotellaceae bacterium]|nr:hypothetical protein [Prevotellaceae bacterium]